MDGSFPATFCVVLKQSLAESPGPDEILPHMQFHTGAFFYSSQLKVPNLPLPWLPINCHVPQAGEQATGLEVSGSFAWIRNTGELTKGELGHSHQN